MGTRMDELHFFNKWVINRGHSLVRNVIDSWKVETSPGNKVKYVWVYLNGFENEEGIFSLKYSVEIMREEIISAGEITAIRLFDTEADAMNYTRSTYPLIPFTEGNKNLFEF